MEPSTISSTLERLALTLPVLLLAVSVHESAHAWAAYKLGDDTAQKLGRISLYPPRHLDWVGSLLVPVLTALSGWFVFGWAKPTPVDPSKLRHPKRGFSLVAAAGPASNLLLAFGVACLARFAIRAFGTQGLLIDLCVTTIQINLMLGLINLLPLPGFDGMKALYAFLPDEWCWRLSRAESFFVMFLILAYYVGFFSVLDKPFAMLSRFLLGLAGVGPGAF